MISRLIDFITESEDLKRTLGIGYLSALFMPLLLPVVLTQGYNMKIIREVENGSDTLPVFDDMFGIFVDGLKIGFVWLLYLIPFVGLMAVSTMIGNQHQMWVVQFVIAFSYLWFVPSIAREYAINGVKSSLNVFKVLKQSFARKYVYYAIWIKLIILIGNIVGFLLVVSIVGIPLLPLSIFVFYTTLGYLTGLAFRETEE